MTVRGLDPAGPVDPGQAAEAFAEYYPGRRAEQMRAAARLAREPSADPADVSMLVDDLAPWLAQE